jgi:hypothetical protein
MCGITAIGIQKYAYIHMLCLTLKTTRPTQNEQKNDRQNTNASPKSKELHPHAQSQRNAAHLLLPQPHHKTA